MTRTVIHIDFYILRLIPSEQTLDNISGDVKNRPDISQKYLVQQSLRTRNQYHSKI